MRGWTLHSKGSLLRAFALSGGQTGGVQHNCAFYIDGFNLYNGRLTNSPQHKWLNLEALCDRLCGDELLSQVYYFTANVKPGYDQSIHVRQQRYIQAIKRHTNVQCEISQFQPNEQWAELVKGHRTKPDDYEWNKPVPAKVKVRTLQEKDSDVALASHLLRDAARKKYDQYFVISGDSDFTVPIRMAVDDFGAFVTLIIPQRQRPDGTNPTPKKLLQAASAFNYLDDKDLEAAQFPMVLKMQDKRDIRRPQEWSRS